MMHSLANTYRSQKTECHTYLSANQHVVAGFADLGSVQCCYTENAFIHFYDTKISICFHPFPVNNNHSKCAKLVFSPRVI